MPSNFIQTFLEYLASFSINIVSSIAFALVALLLFDIETLKYRVFSKFGIKLFKTFEKVNHREQVIRLFDRIFIRPLAKMIMC